MQPLHCGSVQQWVKAVTSQKRDNCDKTSGILHCPAKVGLAAAFGAPFSNLRQALPAECRFARAVGSEGFKPRHAVIIDENRAEWPPPKRHMDGTQCGVLVA